MICLTYASVQESMGKQVRAVYKKMYLFKSCEISWVKEQLVGNMIAALLIHITIYG